MIFIAAGLPGFVLAFSIFLIPEPKRRKLSGKSRKTHVTYGDYFRYALTNIRFVGCHHLAIVVVMIVATGMATWTPSYFIRVHGWSADQVGFWLGVVLAAGPLISIPIHGAMADRLFRGGRKDGHLYYLKTVLLLSIVPGILAYVIPYPWISLILIGIAQALMVAYAGLFPSALQLMVPGDMRGKAAAIALLAGGVGGMALGPMLVAILTESVFLGPDQVGRSLATCFAIFLPIAILLITFSQKPMRELK